jgi:hypothetical protein
MNAQTDRSARGVRRLVPRSALGRILVLAAVVALIAGVTAAALSAAGTTPSAGTVRGVVVYGPLLPIDPGSRISWTTEKADVFVYGPDASAPLRTVHTGSDGRFAITLGPGRYRLSAQPSGISTMPVSHDVTLTVTAGGTAHARILLDSGVRFPANPTARPARVPSGGPWPHHQGLVGQTRIGPVSPLTRPGQVNDKPYAAVLQVLHLDGGLLATVHSTTQHGFAVALPAGTYIVQPLGGGPVYPRAAAPFSISVAPGAWQAVRVVYDSGIR